MTSFATLLVILGSLTWVFAQHVAPNRGLLNRRYQEGEKLSYCMKATNEDFRYEIRSTGALKRDSAGRYFEEYAWSNLISDRATVTLPPSSMQFCQVLSLDPDKPPSIPNLGGVHRMLIGPITDLLTFYADL